MSEVTVTTDPTASTSNSRKNSRKQGGDGSSEPVTLHNDMAQVVRGVCMGMADVVPGVSGGTVALILGIYERLVNALSHVDRTFFRHLRAGRWGAAAKHLDLRFLATLAVGIFAGFLIMTLLINHLLTHETTRTVTLSVFFGTIVGASVMIGSQVHPRHRLQFAQCLAIGLSGAGLAFWLSTLRTGDPAGPTDPTYGFLFFSGSIAICAMILPGISGAMILLLLGVYVYLTDIPHALLHGEDVVRHLLTIAVFGSGALISLICFSKVLRWLLTNYQPLTMALLSGFMVGALPKIWPFQQDLTPAIEKVKYKTFAPYLPASLDGSVWSAVGGATLAAVAVLLIHYITLRRKGKASRGSA